MKVPKAGKAAGGNVSDDRTLREHVIRLLRGGSAHAAFDDVVSGFPPELRGRRFEISLQVPGRNARATAASEIEMPYSGWELLEHIRIAQWDILEFSRNPKHVSPEWPAGYWPRSAAPRDPRAWSKSVQSFKEDLQAMEDLVQDPATELFTPIVHGDGQTILREALLVADHNAYHLGQMVLLRKLLRAWKE
jgi:hypothetical protein